MELQQQLNRPVVQSLLALLRLRNSHPAFRGAFQLAPSPADQIVVVWRNGAEWTRLDVDLAQMCASVTCSTAGAGVEGALVWESVVEA